MNSTPPNDVVIRLDRADKKADHFLLKGLAKVRTEWSLITLAYNSNAC